MKPNSLGILATLLVGVLLGMLLYKHLQPQQDPEMSAALLKKAYEAGRMNTDYTANQEVLNNVCYTWWFGLTHKDRRLNVPKRGKQ